MQRLFWVTLRVSRRLQVNEGYQDGGRYFPVAVPVAVPVAACRIGQFEGSRSTPVVTPPACAWETCRPSRRGLRRRFCHQEHWQQHDLQYLVRFNDDVVGHVTRPKTVAAAFSSRMLVLALNFLRLRNAH